MTLQWGNRLLMWASNLLDKCIPKSQSLEKLQNLQVICQELSRLATPFLPSHRPNLPGFTDSPEGVANLLLGVANLVVSTVRNRQKFLGRNLNLAPSNLFLF